MRIVYNWHITEKCNYSCHFCFAKWRQSNEIWKDKSAVTDILNKIAESKSNVALKSITECSGNNATRINFVGGEPLIIGERLISYARIAKGLKLSTSMITNGTLLRKFIKIVNYIDTVGISIDSLNHDTNLLIGRTDNQGHTISRERLNELIFEVRKINPSIEIKFNVVVNAYNWNEILVPQLLFFNPAKIKIFRQLPFGAEKGISKRKFDHFLEKNDTDRDMIYKEDNCDMRNSYLMIDPQGRFFQNGNADGYEYSEPIQDVGLNAALQDIKFDCEKFLRRYKIGA